MVCWVILSFGRSGDRLLYGEIRRPVGGRGSVGCEFEVFVSSVDSVGSSVFPVVQVKVS